MAPDANSNESIRKYIGNPYRQKRRVMPNVTTSWQSGLNIAKIYIFIIFVTTNFCTELLQMTHRVLDEYISQSIT